MSPPTDQDFLGISADLFYLMGITLQMGRPISKVQFHLLHPLPHLALCRVTASETSYHHVNLTMGHPIDMTSIYTMDPLIQKAPLKS